MRRNCKCNALVINVLYSAKSEVLSVFSPCFIPEYDAVFVSRKLQKWIVLLLLLPDLGRVSMPMNPISLPSTPQNSTSAPLFRCSEPPFPHTPKPHLGYPILPFGVSHFTIWGVFSAHLRTMYSPDFRFVFFVFVAKVCVFLSFRFIMFLRDSFGWIKYIS